jgi:hypothetical protein
LVSHACDLFPSCTTHTNLHFTEGSALYKYIWAASVFHHSIYTFLSVAVIIALVGIPIFHTFLIAGNVAENAHGIFGALWSALYALCGILYDVWALVSLLSKHLAFVFIEAGLYFSHRIDIPTIGKYYYK